MNFAEAFAMTVYPEAPALAPEIHAKAGQAHAETMALAEALNRSTFTPGNNTIH